MFIQGYSDVSISRSGVRHDRVCDLNWGVYFKFDADIRELFPYINGAVDGAKYYDRPLHVRFVRDGANCALYPVEAMAAPFRGRDHIFDFIEDLVVFLNDLYDHRADLTPSNKIHREPASIVDIVKDLPRTNCQKCGYATCMAFAAALRNGETTPADCPDFAEPISVSTVYPVFGPDGTVESTIAIETNGRETISRRNPPQAQLQQVESSANNRSEQTEPLYDRFGIRIQKDLTGRKLEVLRLMADGASNSEISQMLHISPHTVKSHVIHIFNKLNVNDRTQASVWAVRNQII